ncbi:homocysteine S-methyltransferase [Paenibacillus sp. PK4536]|uniref:homocysteine S-methyltransferase n=1 Tax=Paenibacillus sp. PK4536 TaxID=3024576 RepID=UPI002358900E|nr:homocysteine S-methyltransferase [Paenibacillus sp. PK4536]WIM40208.1 homocysteine S-methyltransferase [Paenibacillus sp. PK4536]
MNPIQYILQHFPFMVLDGAMATELERRGADLNNSLWSAQLLLENPEWIADVHREYFEVGADCAITASYQATIEGFVQKGLTEQEAIHLIQQSVQLAVEARDQFWAHYVQKYRTEQPIEGSADTLQPTDDYDRPKPIVAASVGPYGAFLADGSEYRGDYDLNEQQLIDFHRPRIQLLIEAGADILACETIPCLVEARAIVKVLEEFPGSYAWISFSAKDGQHISSGESIADCAKWLHAHEQVAAIGVNCTALEYIPSLIEQIATSTDKPIVVYPNSGEQYDPVTKTWHGASCEQNYGQQAQQWYAKGARLIGGCCRTTPNDIAQIKESMLY